MASGGPSSPYGATQRRTQSRWPLKVPTTGGFQFGTAGSAGKQIPSHPLYRYPLRKMKQKWGVDAPGGEVYESGFEAQDYQAYGGAETGMTKAQWDALAKGTGGGLGDVSVFDPDIEGGAIAGINPETGQWQRAYGGDEYAPGGQYGSIGETLEQGRDYWEGVYQGGGYGFPNWAKGWYEPARKIAIEDPLKAMPEEYFGTIGEAAGGLPGADDEYFRLETDTGPITGAEPIEEIAGQGLSGVLGIAAGAKSDYESQMERTFGREGELARGRADIARQREEYVASRAPAFEERQALEAKTGMAYSGPAARAISYGKEQESKDLAEFTRKERELETGAQEVKEEAWKAYAGPTGALQDYWGEIANVFHGATQGAQDVFGMGESLLGAWADIGAGGNVAAESRFYGGVAAPYSFQEGAGQYIPMRDFGEFTEEARSIASQIASKAIGKRTALTTGDLDVPDYPEGGYGV